LAAEQGPRDEKDPTGAFLGKFPGLAMAYSRRCRFAVTYTEGVRHKSTVSKSSKGCHSSFFKLVIY